MDISMLYMTIMSFEQSNSIHSLLGWPFAQSQFDFQQRNLARYVAQSGVDVQHSPRILSFTARLVEAECSQIATKINTLIQQARRAEQCVLGGSAGDSTSQHHLKYSGRIYKHTDTGPTRLQTDTCASTASFDTPHRRAVPTTQPHEQENIGHALSLPGKEWMVLLHRSRNR